MQEEENAIEFFILSLHKQTRLPLFFTKEENSFLARVGRQNPLSRGILDLYYVYEKVYKIER